MVLPTDGGLTRRDMPKVAGAAAAGGYALGHAFHADCRPSYKADAAQDGWKRCVAWFKKHLA